MLKCWKYGPCCVVLFADRSLYMILLFLFIFTIMWYYYYVFEHVPCAPRIPWLSDFVLVYTVQPPVCELLHGIAWLFGAMRFTNKQKKMWGEVSFSELKICLKLAITECKIKWQWNWNWTTTRTKNCWLSLSLKNLMGILNSSWEQSVASDKQVLFIANHQYAINHCQYGDIYIYNSL